ncbi:MAG: hypothetical protein ACLFWL_16665 [Candidatus Brocadiia bacterium]
MVVRGKDRFGGEMVQSSAPGVWKLTRICSVLISIYFVIMSFAPVYGADDATEEKARRAFIKGLRSGVEIEEREKIFLNVAKDYPDTRWADDAIWLLSELASGRDKRARAVLLRRELVDREEFPKLEKPTEATPVYRRSRLRQIVFLLENMGHRFRRREGLKIETFNALPMSLHEALAVDYIAMDKLKMARHEYKEALKLAPGEFFKRMYRRRLKGLEKEIFVQEHTGKASDKKESQEKENIDGEENGGDESKKEDQEKRQDSGDSSEKAEDNSGKEKSGD